MNSTDRGSSAYAGLWQVQPGRADNFVTAWTQSAEWTDANVPDAIGARLLRDLADDHRFVSIGRGAFC